jgi:hypothetical protein
MNISDDLATALIGLKDVIVADYARFLKEIDGSKDKFGIEFETGSKYVKVVSISGGGSRSVHCFVEKANGNILRAASWKAPARNFVRGNVFDQASYINRVRWTGVS